MTKQPRFPFPPLRAPKLINMDIPLSEDVQKTWKDVEPAARREDIVMTHTDIRTDNERR